MSKLGKGTVFAVTLVATAVFAASAFAGGNATLCKVYCKKGTTVQKQVGTFTPPAASSSTDSPSDGQLPFTGLDLGFVALAGALLFLAGFGLLRATRERPERPTD